MRKIYNLLVVIALVVSFSSCEKDNYDAPNGGLYGLIIDQQTGKPVFWCYCAIGCRNHYQSGVNTDQPGRALKGTGQ